MHPQDGPSLPLGRQLHWLLQLQVLHEHALTLLYDDLVDRFDVIPGHRTHHESSRIVRLQGELLRDDSLHLGVCPSLHHHCLHDVPLLPNLVPVHHNRVL